MSKFPPTLEQELILDAGRNTLTSLMIKAYAGCGKTSTLELLSTALPVQPVLCLAFNVKNKKDMESRLPPHFKVMTMNGLGHNAWSKAIGKRCAIDNDKLYKILKAIVRTEAPDTTGEELSACLQLIRRARVTGLVPYPYANTHPSLIADDDAGLELIGDLCYMDVTENMIYFARKALCECIKQSYGGILDFDDQIYMSALFGGVFPKFPLVMVDEAQDLSPLNHLQVKKAAAGRLIVVGDPKQAIYAFRGADSASMDSLRLLRQDWTDLSLSTTFRCPKAIVARQQGHAVGFNAAASAPEGAILDWLSIDKWGVPEGQVSILCRNNAPLFAAALRLIRQGLGITLMGGEIGKSLITFSRKLFPDDSTPRDKCIDRVNEWIESETSKALVNEKLERVAVIRDKGECLIAILENGNCLDAGDMRKRLTSMFSKESLRITLATGHKAKGLEWDNVIHLDPWRVPSKYAQAAFAAGRNAPMEQDLNLRYVIETRTKKTFYLANLEQLP